MKTGTKVGWILVAVSIIISIWVLKGGISKAEDVVDYEGNDFELTLSGDHYVVTGCSCDDYEVVIPTQYDGTPVTEIADGVFSGKKITSVEAPSVYLIGSNAFSGCPQLSTAEFGIPGSVDPSTVICNIGLSAFSDCPELESVEFPNVKTDIGNEAFSGCSQLKSIVLTPDHDLSIGTQAFAYCLSLGGLNLPKGINYLAPNMFEGCAGLKQLNIAPNDKYASDGVAIYSKDMSKLILVPAAATNGEAGSYEIFRGGLINGVDYDGCKEVESGAFDCCTKDSLPNLYVPATVTKWGKQEKYAPQDIYLEAGYDTDLYKNQIFPNYWGNGITSIHGSYDDDGGVTPTPPGPNPPDPPGPDDPTPTTYKIENIIENLDGTIDVVFTGPDVDAGSVKVDGTTLTPSSQYSVIKDASTGKTIIRLAKAYVDTIRPLTGTNSHEIEFTYQNNNPPYKGTFNLSANSTPTPTPGEYAITKIVKSSNGQVKIYFSAPGVTGGTVGGYTLVPGSNCSVMSSATSGTVITLYKDFVDTLRDVYGTKNKVPVYLTYDGKSYTKDFTLGAISTSGGSSSGGTVSPTPSSGGSSSSGTGTVTHLYGSGTTTTSPVGYTTTASSATGTTHTKDTTPSTADGWDARLAFAIAVLLAGIVVLMLSRRNAAKLATIKRDREGEGK